MRKVRPSAHHIAQQAHRFALCFYPCGPTAKEAFVPQGVVPDCYVSSPSAPYTVVGSLRNLLVALWAPPFAREDAAPDAQECCSGELRAGKTKTRGPGGWGIEPCPGVWSCRCFESRLVFGGTPAF